MIEIERKFLLTSEAFKQVAENSTHIIQGYLNADPNRTVRVRITDKKGFLTIKGKSNETGISRFEWEKEIDFSEAKELIKLCEKEVIEKIRYEITSGTHIIEVDEFFGNNEGLLLAEIELNDENESFLKPDWIGKEVTGDPRYYNSFISKNPYTLW
ncbi:CYTH domain-containing protein [Aquimarina addita]|uniref:CYTH domain-containing protein n=1 Tax=Aquimarina addita TaxID=870485 RepID=A0ABP7XBZ6_9FLAO